METPYQCHFDPDGPSKLRSWLRRAGIAYGLAATACACGTARQESISLLLRTLLIETEINLTDGTRCRYGALPRPVPRRRCVDVSLIFSTEKAPRARCSRRSAARLGRTASVAPLCNPCRRGPLLLRAHRVLRTSYHENSPHPGPGDRPGPFSAMVVRPRPLANSVLKHAAARRHRRWRAASRPAGNLVAKTMWFAVRRSHQQSSQQERK